MNVCLYVLTLRSVTKIKVLILTLFLFIYFFYFIFFKLCMESSVIRFEILLFHTALNRNILSCILHDNLQSRMVLHIDKDT